MLKFEHEPTKWSILAGENATAKSTGEKRSLQQDRETFSKYLSIAKIRCFALMNAPYLVRLKTQELKMLTDSRTADAKIHASRRLYWKKAPP
jgi:hypothetical protein